MRDLYKKVVRKRACFWLHPDAMKKLKQLQEETNLSQAKIIENLINGNLVDDVRL